MVANPEAAYCMDDSLSKDLDVNVWSVKREVRFAVNVRGGSGLVVGEIQTITPN
jgi:hypothetical protein